MEWKRYGVTLRRLTLDKIELVRNWRNDPKISRHMFFQEYITKEMQIEWFNKINNDNNYYFIIEYNNEEIGLINNKDINYEKKSTEGGLFIYDDKYLNSDVPSRVSFCHVDFIFEELKLEYIMVKIRTDNKKAVKYNKMLGYILTYSDGEDMFSAVLTKENYYKQRNKYIRILDNI